MSRAGRKPAPLARVPKSLHTVSAVLNVAMFVLAQRGAAVIAGDAEKLTRSALDVLTYPFDPTDEVCERALRAVAAMLAEEVRT